MASYSQQKVDRHPSAADVSLELLDRTFLAVSSRPPGQGDEDAEEVGKPQSDRPAGEVLSAPMNEARPPPPDAPRGTDEAEPPSTGRVGVVPGLDREDAKQPIGRATIMATPSPYPTRRCKGECFVHAQSIDQVPQIQST